MDEKDSSSILNKAELCPVISIRASPAHVNVSLLASAAAAGKISIEFTLRSSRPVTIFVYDTLLSPPPNGHSLIHRTFSFSDTISGAEYKPPVVEWVIIENYDDYVLSYTNANNFLTLYPNTPHIVERRLWPKATDGDNCADPHNMEPRCSYRMHLAESAKKQHLWWAWGRKWQILRWRWWPFGELKDVSDFVLSHKGREGLAEVEFVWEGDCVVHVDE